MTLKEKVELLEKEVEILKLKLKLIEKEKEVPEYVLPPVYPYPVYPVYPQQPIRFGDYWPPVITSDGTGVDPSRGINTYC